MKKKIDAAIKHCGQIKWIKNRRIGSKIQDPKINPSSKRNIMLGDELTSYNDQYVAKNIDTFTTFTDSPTYESALQLIAISGQAIVLRSHGKDPMYRLYLTKYGICEFRNSKIIQMVAGGHQVPFDRYLSDEEFLGTYVRWVTHSNHLSAISYISKKIDSLATILLGIPTRNN